MARINIGTVKTSLGINETYDIVNSIRNSLGGTFERYVPLANKENVAEVGAGILTNSNLQNDFITALVERIGLVIIKHASLSNPLKKFKKGQMPLGRTIEEIFVDITTERKYDPEDAENTLFKREIPNVKTLFHEKNREGYYEQTIQDSSLQTAFVSWDDFGNFVSSIINSIYNSAEVDEFEYMKLLIDNYYAKGQFKVIKVDKPNTATLATEFIKKARAVATKMALPTGSREYNSLAVRTRSDMDSLHLIMDADLATEVDVDVLAKAFNMDKTSFLGNVTIIDGFASTGLEAVMIDSDFFMVYDVLHKMETARNAKGLYWNYFYHVWQILSVSRFSNAVAFVSGAVPAVTQVIIDPVILAVRAGKTHQYKAYVRATDNEAHTLTWSVTGRNGTTVKAGTTVSATGLLTVDATQTGELSVKATTTGGVDIDGAGPDTTDVIGESVVTVLPPKAS